MAYSAMEPRIVGHRTVPSTVAQRRGAADAIANDIPLDFAPSANDEDVEMVSVGAYCMFFCGKHCCSCGDEALGCLILCIGMGQSEINHATNTIGRAA